MFFIHFSFYHKLSHHFYSLQNTSGIHFTKIFVSFFSVQFNHSTKYRRRHFLYFFNTFFLELLESKSKKMEKMKKKCWWRLPWHQFGYRIVQLEYVRFLSFCLIRRFISVKYKIRVQLNTFSVSFVVLMKKLSVCLLNSFFL